MDREKTIEALLLKEQIRIKSVEPELMRRLLEQEQKEKEELNIIL